ncbi:hypothetical protein NDU88_004531 [Pleurodeles waltl]|uniref:Uncharacterized protein n=1 Tax=Pleurodeles waltl TaxID=8319 RepID=A0AAV7VJJ3_PLEWA|nr:hypothetical protein NDU88_004531 [Pleurodeles waltl]
MTQERELRQPETELPLQAADADQLKQLRTEHRDCKARRGKLDDKQYLARLHAGDPSTVEEELESCSVGASGRGWWVSLSGPRSGSSPEPLALGASREGPSGDLGESEHGVIPVLRDAPRRREWARPVARTGAVSAVPGLPRRRVRCCSADRGRTGTPRPAWHSYKYATSFTNTYRMAFESLAVAPPIVLEHCN